MFSKKAKYIIDPITLSLRSVEKSGKYLTKKLLSGLGLSVLVGVCVAAAFFSFTDSPQENKVSRDINFYRLRLEVLNSKSEKILSILNTLQTKDDRTYRTIFAMDPLSEEERNPGVGGPSNANSQYDVVENGQLLKETVSKLDLISRRIVVQSRSFQDLSVMIQNKEKMLASIPSIMPLDRNRVKLSSGFGWRRNPFSRAGSQFHPGIDLAGKIGTPIYATGDGVVIDPLGSMTGYGIVIVIDHGYGFRTLYAHLSKKLVKEGEVVKRGQEIGKLGNTGPSTGPHLHYEVIRNGQKVNPINYIYSGFTNEEFQLLIKEAEENSKILS
ncbi:MAG: hypothetical protein A2W93_14520 [Bacteroidetes bacterium GWF2_43_63]|nr:MAG: hypothetical protein A2W94_01090 [Bacteroidetes bacterium GWE2_42_42]OFY52555.1 MAG: hypothetical protein A2W93_14520 [Bacteroidetes bacterium GWF2_43_63]HBG71463.1 peptidase M23 [Bacteroidales bacterium]HCB60785.1 peptidase M23 [Bacteroidales bacterium]HCY23490.1 peptidase M23 [Bacteroidales bacterium]